MQALSLRFKTVRQIEKWAASRGAEVIIRGGAPYVHLGQLILEIIEVRA